MKFQELLAGKQINWDRVKLIRHNLTKEEVAANYERGIWNCISRFKTTHGFGIVIWSSAFWGRKAQMVFSKVAIALVVQSHISAHNSQKVLYQIAV